MARFARPVLLLVKVEYTRPKTEKGPFYPDRIGTALRQRLQDMLDAALKKAGEGRLVQAYSLHSYTFRMGRKTFFMFERELDIPRERVRNVQTLMETALLLQQKEEGPAWADKTVACYVAD